MKFAVLDPQTGQSWLGGLVERVGTPDASMTSSRNGKTRTETPTDTSYSGVLRAILGHLTDLGDLSLLGVGHRVVHGGERFTESVVIDDDVLSAIRGTSHLAPLHNPANLEGIGAARAVLPDVPQVAVFDTAFHHSMPRHAYHYAIPRTWYLEHGVRRYGFHGNQPPLRRRARGAADRTPARRAASGDRASGQRLQCHRGARRPLGGHQHGADPARRSRDGNAVRRPRPGHLRVHGRAARHGGPRAHQDAELRERAAGPVRPQQRHAHPHRPGRRPAANGAKPPASPSTCSATGSRSTSRRSSSRWAASMRWSSPVASASTASACAAASWATWVSWGSSRIRGRMPLTAVPATVASPGRADPSTGRAHQRGARHRP